ncbi:glycosyltransferase family 39 protein [Isosphaeraceae bacterium EP7]
MDAPLVVTPPAPIGTKATRWCLPAVALAALVGGWLIVDASPRSSATYDEVSYLEIGCRWWRTGDQERITRMGSPLTFWKLQQAPVLAVLDRTGHSDWIDDPIGHQAELLTHMRIGSLWIWILGLIAVATWARQAEGPRAMAFAAWLYALSPNLLAHAGLVTMEQPLVTASAIQFWLFWRFLRFDESRSFWTSAMVGGLAFSCKFTAILFPPLFALAWASERYRRGGIEGWKMLARMSASMACYVLVLLAADLVITAGATLPLSEQVDHHPKFEARFGARATRLFSFALETPIPADWVGFAIQGRHQSGGGASYLLGQRSLWGWRSYYLIALAVKLPLSVFALALVRLTIGRRPALRSGDLLIPVTLVAFLVLTSLGSSRNYGLRYLFPLAPAAIVGLSSLAERSRLIRRLTLIGLAGQAFAVASIHPHELTFFNVAAGGPMGGMIILADSNLDWGQGARSLARLQLAEPAYRDLTFYAFGDTDPGFYGVVGRRIVVNADDIHSGLPERLEAETPYLAVSTSLIHGPWGPAGYFDDLKRLRPVAQTDDRTILIYRTPDSVRP